MREFFIDFFADFGKYIIFLHLLGALVWIGGMIAIKFAVCPALLNIRDEKLRLSRVLEVMQRFFNIVLPFIIMIVFTSVFMNVGMGFKFGDPTLYTLIQTKETIWTLMTINFVYICIKRNSAQKMFLSDDMLGCQENIKMILNYLLPMNIFLGAAALYIGTTLRGI